jgi:hypothetical protein
MFGLSGFPIEVNHFLLAGNRVIPASLPDSGFPFGPWRYVC